LAEILYRKWRPQTFAELAGQEHIATTLRNALASDRIAHAYLFAGPRGTGKTTTGRLLGKALNCTDRRGGDPCNECESCLSFVSGRAIDLIELDAASNRGIEEMRSIRDKIGFAPGAGSFKVYLIDEVHMLTEAAFNALLKTLEEPPPHVVFILATTEAHKVPATIASRCQRFDFRRVPMAGATARLQHICDAEGFSVESAALELIVQSSTGSMRDAVNLLDQLVTSYGRELSVEHVKGGLGLIDDERAGLLARGVLAGDLGRGLEIIASVRDDGLDLRQFQRQVVKELRALLLVKSGLEPKEGVTAERKREMQSVVAAVPVERVLAALRAFGEADLKQDPNSTLPLDIALADTILIGAGTPQPRTEAPPQTQPRAQTQPARQAPTRAPQPESRPPAMPAPASAEKAPDLVAGGPPPKSGARGPDTESVVKTPAPSGSGTGKSVPPDLARARDALPRVYDAMKEVHIRALLNSGCDIIEVGEEGIVLGFRFPNHARKMQEPQNLKALADTLSQVIGSQVNVRCVHDATVESWKQRATASRSPLVRAAQEMGARVLPRDEE
jgi:DNA polymerase III subunit gamma/tau